MGKDQGRLQLHAACTHSCTWHTWRGQERREQTLGSSTRFWKALPTSLSSPARANPQQPFWMQKVGKKKTNMYREPGSERGVIPIRLFILQILTRRCHSTGLNSHISSFTDFYKPPLYANPHRCPGGIEGGETICEPAVPGPALALAFIPRCMTHVNLVSPRDLGLLISEASRGSTPVSMKHPPSQMLLIMACGPSLGWAEASLVRAAGPLEGRKEWEQLGLARDVPFSLMRLS